MTAISAPYTEPASGLTLRRGGNTAAPTGRLLLLHGVGSNESNLAPLIEYLPATLEVLLVRGPVELGPQRYGFYPVSFANGKSLFDPAVAESARQQLIALLQALPPLPTVIGGFSQGGIMSAGVALTTPSLVKGFAVLSGRMLEEFAGQMAPREDLAELTAFVAHGRQDQILPVTYATQTQAWLERLGVEQDVRLYDMGHEIVGEEVADFGRWLVELMG